MIPYRLYLTVSASRHELRIDFRHLLGNQPVLLLPLRVLFIAKDDGAELHQSAT